MIICAPRSTRSLLSKHGVTRRRGPAAARCESQWPVDVACLAPRRRALALIQARQRVQQHAFIFAHANFQPSCSMIMFIAERWLLACSKRNRRANTTRAAPPFSRLQNACRGPTHSTSCSCNFSPASSAIRIGGCSTRPDVPAAATRMAVAEQRHAQSRLISRRQIRTAAHRCNGCNRRYRKRHRSVTAADFRRSNKTRRSRHRFCCRCRFRRRRCRFRRSRAVAAVAEPTPRPAVRRSRRRRNRRGRRRSGMPYECRRDVD